MARQKHVSLRRTFIIALISAYAVSALASTLVFIASARRLTDSYVQRVAESRSLLDQNRIKALIGREAALCLKLADDPAIKNWLADETEPTLREQAFAQLSSYQRLFRDRTIFIATAGLQDYHLALPDSFFGQPSRLDPENPADRWFYETFSRQEDYWINVNYDRLLDEVRVWINTIVRDSSGQVLGVAGTGMELTAFLADLVQHDETRVTTIISNFEGQILAHPDQAITEFNARVQRDEDRISITSLFPDKFSKTQLEEAMSYVRAHQPADFAMDSRPVILDLKQAGRPLTLAVSSIPELTWYTFVLVESALFASSLEYVPFLLAPLISLTLLILLVLTLLNRLVLLPIGLLTEASRRISDGDYNITLEVPRQYETGLLAHAFTEMSAQIRHYTGQLESMVDERTKELARSRDHILESIRYGKLVQTSIMPSAADLASNVRGHFMHLQPLDTVGGDFVFFQPTRDGFVAALADCTGHGVPGAIMSMLGASLLNRVVDTLPDAGPSDLLAELHRLLCRNLRAAQDTDHFENGMDIGLCRYQREQDSLQYCGAGLPLFVLENRASAGMRRLDGDQLHLGFSRSGKHLSFRQHSVADASTCVFVSVSDGIFDQPGGERGFGLGMQRFGSLLEEMTERKDKSADAQALGGQILEKLKAWQNSLAQRDDCSLFIFTPKKAIER